MSKRCGLTMRSWLQSFSLLKSAG